MLINAFLVPFLITTISANPLLTRSTSHIINNALDALGGEQALEDLKGIVYHAPRVYRSRSLMQGYDMNKADTSVAITGGQSISFDFSTDVLRQRIDRNFVPSDYWSWASPQLDRFNFTLVVQSGKEGFACYTQGNNELWLPVNMTSGYTDAALAEYLVLHGTMMSPKLLLQMKSSNATSFGEVDINGVTMPAVFDRALNITVIFNPETYLPYIIRTLEQHPIYGNSTNDLVLSNYSSSAGSKLLHPRHIQTVYNASSTLLDVPLEDFVIETIEIGPQFAVNFFDGIPEDQSFLPKSAPRKVEGVTHAYLTEYTSNLLYSGLDNTTVKDLKAMAPVDGLPTVHWLILKDDYLGVKQLIIEFDTEVIMGDATPDWSLIAIEWVKENIGKPITHVFPTHHHRDHSGGVPNLVAIGAKIIVPEVAVKYWSNIPDVKLITFNASHPYVHKDSKIQAWFRWEEQATHAVDWTYAFITTLCPEAGSPAIVFEADAWHGGMSLENNDQVEMRSVLNQFRLDGLTKNATIYPTHGQIRPLTDMIAATGYVYPNLKTTDWMNGQAMC